MCFSLLLLVNTVCQFIHLPVVSVVGRIPVHGGVKRLCFEGIEARAVAVELCRFAEKCYVIPYSYLLLSRALV